MTREVRANLLFLSAFVVLSAPGFGILMYKKLHGGAGQSNAMPDPVPSQIAYMQPLPAPPVPRREPREIRLWVKSLVRDRLGQTAAALFEQPAAPIVSDHFVTQFAGLSFENGHTTFAVVCWDERDLSAEPPPDVAVDFGSGALPFQVDKLESIDLPKDLRHTLQNVGYIDPPQRVWWIAARGDSTGGSGVPREATLTFSPPGQPRREVISFNSPAIPATAPTPEAQHAHF